MDIAITVRTYLIVVVFGGVHDPNISGFQRLARRLEPVVQLLGNAKSAGACPCVFSWQWVENNQVGSCGRGRGMGRTSP